ncbi:FtsK/SpoIIIE family DNA translocase [Vagococcus fessus]|uniref:DNA translocase FtsK n=1 Tax=Vagococcus fessus TaxID=120370 RepID=A0A430A5I7_9ENTE|nr:DNA translocase FtsK [Vagococcus fessus]RSU02049.1 cell division protein FtsK [Vagococcus fessus]
MAQKKKSRPKKMTKKQQAQQERMYYVVAGLIISICGILGLFKLGFLGILFANIFRMFVGVTFPILAILFILMGVLLIFMGPNFSFGKTKYIGGASLFYFGLLLMLHAILFRDFVKLDIHIMNVTWHNLWTDLRGGLISQPVGGGLIGGTLYSGTHFLVSQAGSYVVAGLLMFIGICVAVGVSGFEIFDFFKRRTESMIQKLSASAETRKELRAKRLEEREKKRALALEKAEKEKQTVVQEKKQDTKVEPKVTPVYEEQVEPVPVAIDTYQSQYQESSIKKPESVQTVVEDDDNGEDLEFDIPQETENTDYILPPSTLLNEIPLTDQSEEYKSIEHNVEVLEQTFDSFGVDAKVVRASLGPSVTKYEIQPAVGVKVSKIVGLTDDLALALAAKDIRMEAPIPGKSLIGIEVPNNTVSTVSFRDIIEAQPKNPDNLLEVPLGRDISGSVISADLAKMPHMLIAGSTGSGKSVCINGIITSILMRAKPHEVKMMMIDPKMVELNVYNGIPHLLTPVVTNPRKASQALHKVVAEMEKRYELFAASGVRNITGYNQMVQKNNTLEGVNHPILPFIVVIVDELADLMMVASNEVEDAIIRLAQMARAAGIHMILATQRPSVDVITGIIKANVPSRIAFAVSSGIDSRTIIDTTGAEKLLGRGDMLFMPMGQNKPTRVQGAFISDSEVEDLVKFVTEQQGADYREDMMPTDEPEKGSGPDSEVDDLYDEAVKFVAFEGKASASLIQRRFRVGYNRAARLIDQMEENGVVGPSEGSKGRKVLMGPPSSVSEEESDQTVSPNDLPF